eukprot:1763306-Rhodomonas_salina.1
MQLKSNRDDGTDCRLLAVHERLLREERQGDGWRQRQRQATTRSSQCRARRQSPLPRPVWPWRQRGQEAE